MFKVEKGNFLIFQVDLTTSTTILKLKLPYSLAPEKTSMGSMTNQMRTLSVSGQPIRSELDSTTEESEVIIAFLFFSLYTLKSTYLYHNFGISWFMNYILDEYWSYLQSKLKKTKVFKMEGGGNIIPVGF